MALKILHCLFLVRVSGYWSHNGWAHVAVELLVKVRLKVLRLVARLGWSMLLRFLHESMLVRWGMSYVSSVDLDPNG